MDPSGIYANCQVARNHPFEHECNEPKAQLTAEVLERRLHEKNKRGWRRVALHFTPSWFSVCMGTGIVSILLHNFPYPGRWLYWLSVIVFCLNVFLFIIFVTISITRYTVYRGIFHAMLRHPVQSLFLVLVCVPSWGNWAAQFAWALWWIDVVLSTSTCFYLPFVVMYVHDTQLSTMTAAWLLPIASAVVASASGGIVAPVLSNPQHALWTLILSYALWGMGMSLAMVVLVMYFHRLTVHKLPPREVIVSVFLPLGPVGQGGYAIQQLGKVARDIFPKTDSLIPGAGDTLYTMGFIVALILWGYGLAWLFFALASISQSRFPFNMGWWGFTFPLGVFAASTTQMAKELPSAFFKVLGSIFSVVVVLLWLVVSARTLMGVITRKIFFAPCAAEYEKQFNARKARKDLERATEGKKRENEMMKR